MTSPEDVPPELAELFRAERAAPPPPDAMKAAMLARVQHVAMAGAGTSLFASVWVKGIAVVVLGVGAAGGWYGVHVRSHAAAPVVSTVVHSTRPAPTPSRPAQVVASAVATAIPTPTVTAPTPLAAPTPVYASTGREPSMEAPSTDEDLARENALMERARDALRRRDVPGVHAAVHEHAATFPHGRLTEEREAIWIEADVVGGDRAEAEARAARFRRRYPQSVELGVIDSALEGNAP